MKKIQAYGLFNDGLDGPLPGIYPDLQSIKREAKGFPDVTWKPYPWIWNGFLEQEALFKDRGGRTIVSPHAKCTEAPCFNPARIEYRAIDPKADRKPDYFYPTDYVDDFNSVGALLDAFDEHSLCKIKLCRYTIYADAIIPLDLFHDLLAFAAMVNKQIFREKYRIYAISENCKKRSINFHRIIYTDTDVWYDIPGD